MNALTDWIRRHQIAAFFAIAFAITWGLGFSYAAVMRRGMVLLIPLASIATCGPALAGIVLSMVCNTEPKSGSSRRFWLAFAVALVASTLVFLAHQKWVNHAPVSLMIGGLVLVVALPVAVVIGAAYARAPAVRRALASLIDLRGAIGWSVLAVVLVPALHLLSIAISGWLGRQPALPTPSPAAGLPLVRMIAITFLYQFFFYNGTGEEVGWSGFARPMLQARLSPLLTSLLMNALWALWHAFFWYGEGRPVFSWTYWADTYVKLLPASVLIGWFYNRSRGSILVAGIVHATANTAFAFLPDLDWPVYTATMYAAALAMVAIDRMWKRLPAGHAAVHRPSSGHEPMNKHVGKGEERRHEWSSGLL